MSERQRYGEGRLRAVYTYFDFRMDEIVLPPQGSTGDRIHSKRAHTGIVFKGDLTLYKEVGSGVAVEHYGEGDQFTVDYGQSHRITAGENGVELIQISIPLLEEE